MKRLIPMMVILLVMCCSPAWGATYYMAKISGVWKFNLDAWPTASTGTATATIRTGAAACGAGNTVVIEAGTYTGAADLSADSCIFATVNQIIRSPAAGDADHPAHSGPVVLDGTGLTSYTANITGAGTTLQNITVQNATPGYAALRFGANGSAVGVSIKGPQTGIATNAVTIGTAGLTVSLSKMTIEGATDYAVYSNSSGGAVTLSHSKILNCAKGIRHSYGAFVDRNNTFYGVTGNNVYVTGNNSQTYSGSNSIYGPITGTSIANTHNVLNDSTNATVTINNSIILNNPTNRQYYTSGTLTLNNILGSSPRIVSPRRAGIISIVFDDANSWDQAQLVAAKADVYGYKITWCVDTNNMTPERWAIAADLISRGHEIASHSMTHADLTSLTDAQLTNEVYGSRTAIQTALGGYTPVTLIYPGTLQNATVRAKVAEAGYIGARGGNGLAPNGLDMSALSIYQVFGNTPGGLFFGATGTQTDNPTEAEIRRKVASLSEWLCHIGGVVSVYAHDGPAGSPTAYPYDFTSQQWDWFFSEISKTPVMVKTFADTVRYIQANASGTTGSGGELVYTRTWSDQSDYHLLPFSSAIGAGAAITGVHDQATPATDFEGNIVHFLPPTIGAYEPQGSTKTVTSNYSPTGYTVRGTDSEPAELIVGTDGITINLSGLTANEAITVKAKKKTFSLLTDKAKHTIKADGGGSTGLKFGF